MKEDILHLEESAWILQMSAALSKVQSRLIKLLDLSDSVNRHMDGGDLVNLLHLGFQKAFDQIPYQRLLSELSGHGIIGPVLLWITN